MCLITYDNIKHKARTNITTYKVLLKLRELETPFIFMPVDGIDSLMEPLLSGRVYERYICTDWNDGRLYDYEGYNREKVYVLDKGYIHSWLSIEAALVHFDNILDDDYIIVKSHIPIGAEYYTGYFEDICSTKLKLDGIIVPKIAPRYNLDSHLFEPKNEPIRKEELVIY